MASSKSYSNYLKNHSENKDPEQQKKFIQDFNDFQEIVPNLYLGNQIQ